MPEVQSHHDCMSLIQDNDFPPPPITNTTKNDCMTTSETFDIIDPIDLALDVPSPILDASPNHMKESCDNPLDVENDIVNTIKNSELALECCQPPKIEKIILEESELSENVIDLKINDIPEMDKDYCEGQDPKNDTVCLEGSDLKIDDIPEMDKDCGEGQDANEYIEGDDCSCTTTGSPVTPVHFEITLKSTQQIVKVISEKESFL